MTVAADVRMSVASERGLPESAADLLVGSSIAEVEESADALVGLLAKYGREQQPVPEQVDPIAAALAGKAERKRALAEAIIGPRRQPRDEQGRFTSFDGGARPTMPTWRHDPIVEHDQAVTRLAALAATFRGTTF
jgi:hypothetical protein